MRRVTLMLAAMAMMVSLFAVVAYAATIEGTDKIDTITETQRNDTIAGHAGGDEIDATTYTDDTEKVNGNRGADKIYVDDLDELDTVKGGKGDDVCVGDPGDELDCETEVIK